MHQFHYPDLLKQSLGLYGQFGTVSQVVVQIPVENLLGSVSRISGKILLMLVPAERLDAGSRGYAVFQIQRFESYLWKGAVVMVFPAYL